MKSSRLSREALLTAGLFILLAVLTAAAALREARPENSIPLDSASTAPSGARALYLWLDELGYEVSNDVGTAFTLPPETGAAVILEPFPSPGFAEADLDAIEAWVREGGTLIYAAERFGTGSLPAHFGFSTGYRSDPAAAITATVPLAERAIPLNALAYFVPEDAAYTPVAALPEGPVVVEFSLGEGRVVLCTAPYPFSNAGLKEPGSGEFILHVLGPLPPEKTVWFDEWHHGRRGLAASEGGPGDWLIAAPAGRAVFFSALAVFVWLALSGRSFGRPLAVQQEALRRAPEEYVTAIANLNRRAGNRRHLLRQYHGQLKRNLARRWPIDPALPDEPFLAELSRCAPEVDIENLRRLLADLNRVDVSEADMVRIAGKAADFGH